MRVAVFGAGYAGLTLARKLEQSLPETVDLVVVDESGTHLVQHLLHRVVRVPDVAENIVVPLADVLDRASVLEERVTGLDPSDGTATLAGGQHLSYDFGAVCLGARTNFHGLDGVADHATPLKRLHHAERIRDRFPRSGRVVVGGAGLAGVQIAGELAALADERDAETTIHLLEQESRVAPGFRTSFQDAVLEALNRADVSVRTDVRVRGADAETVRLADRTELAYDQLVWTGGIVGVDDVRDDRPEVPATLRASDSTFVLGDAARVVDAAGRAVAPSARAATEQAAVAATNLSRLVQHRLDGGGGFEPRLDRYRADDGPWLVTVGDDAVAQVGPTVLTGQAATALKTSVGAQYLSSVGAVGNAVELVREKVGW